MFLIIVRNVDIAKEKQVYISHPQRYQCLCFPEEVGREFFALQ